MSICEKHGYHHQCPVCTILHLRAQRDALKEALEECYAELCEYAPKYKLRPENQYQKALDAVKEKT